MEPVTPGPLRAGTVIRTIFDVAGDDLTLDLKVAACERPSLWRHTVDEHDFHTTVEYRFESDAAGTRGLDVDCDSYPYAAGSNPLKNLLPQWVQAGGVEAMLERLRRPQTRERIRSDIARDGLNNWGRIPSWGCVRISISPAAFSSLASTSTPSAQIRPTRVISPSHRAKATLTV